MLGSLHAISCPLLTEKLSHHSLLGSLLLSCGSCCGLTASVVSCKFSALVLCMYVQHLDKLCRNGSLSWEGPTLDSFARVPQWPSSRISSLWKQSRREKIEPYREISLCEILKAFVSSSIIFKGLLALLVSSPLNIVEHSPVFAGVVVEAFAKTVFKLC